jgi:hypothetical protein
MTFSPFEHRIVVIGLKLAVVIGFIACLGFVGALFLPAPFGERAFKAFGCAIAMDAVAILYLWACQAVISAWTARKGA